MLQTPISISNWMGGISDSVYQGIPGSHAEITGLDYRTEPGVLQIHNKMTKASGTIQCRIRNFVSSTATEGYAIGGLADSPQIYRSTNSGATWAQLHSVNGFSAGLGQGSIIWRGYIFLGNSSYLEIFNPSTGSDTVQWKPIDKDTEHHPMVRGERDGSLYIGCGRYVALLTEVSGKTFEPNDSSTYSWNSQALDLPPDFRIRSIEDLGRYLMLGCWQTASNGSILPVAIIYPWDYVLRPQSHEGPISMKRRAGVTAQLNINNKLYAWVGGRGEIFYFNGSKLIRIKKMPVDPQDTVNPGAVTSNFNDYPMFGIRNATDNALSGVYSFGTTEERSYPLSLSLDYPLSPTSSNDYDVNAIGTTGALNNVLLASWAYVGDNFGIDYLDTTTKLATGALFTTLLYRIGRARDNIKPKIEGFEIFLDEALATGQSINIKWRRTTGDSWTDVNVKGRSKTMDYANVGARTELYVSFPINNIVNLQFRVEFVTTGNTTPKLREILIQ